VTTQTPSLQKKKRKRKNRTKHEHTKTRITKEKKAEENVWHRRRKETTMVGWVGMVWGSEKERKEKASMMDETGHDNSARRVVKGTWVVGNKRIKTRIQ
jgi:hypothetical protein